MGRKKKNEAEQTRQSENNRSDAGGHLNEADTLKDFGISEVSQEVFPEFVFTESGFQVDIAAVEPENRAEIRKRWEGKNGFSRLYALSLDPEFDVGSEAWTKSLMFLVGVSEAYFRSLTKSPGLEILREKVRVEADALDAQKILDQVPFVLGAQYVSQEWIQGIFDGLHLVFSEEISSYSGKVAAYFSQKSNKFHISERIYFHLVQSREEAFPFAFMATYTTGTENEKIRHMPLRYALTEFRNERNKLMELLSCLNGVAEKSDFIASMMESGELFSPIRLTSSEAYDFLKQVEEIEHLGVVCRIPNWWRRKSTHIAKTMKLGEKEPAVLGLDTLISLTPTLTLDGMELSGKDIRDILSQSEGLALFKGKWVEVDHERLRRLLSEMENEEQEITFLEALRRKGQSLSEQNEARRDLGERKDKNEQDGIRNGTWLSSVLDKLSHPEGITRLKLPSGVKAKLRPYQMSGYKWLCYMSSLGFGACLADDMGLGKTIQVLSYLEHLRKKDKDAKVLLIVPASLLGNWQREIQKFVPKMPFSVFHGRSAVQLGADFIKDQSFLNITTYATASKLAGLEEVQWEALILDEAQAIKNPMTKQTKQIKRLQAKMRIAMTGTPIENDLTNLWSLFDFLNRGLLGTSKEFGRFCRDLKQEPRKYIQLKTMISPFLLRRVKADKNIIEDLPEKFEGIKYAGLSKKQTVLYKKVVSDMEKKIFQSEGIGRRGLILSTIMKLKQICNHPDQYLGQMQFAEEESGKFIMLRELCEIIYEKRERVLIFTQFREISEYLASFLRSIFHAEGFVLHGSTPVKERNKMVEAFQREEYIPFMVLSVKAGGTGLNLTKANHVIHFDRWWNPAVENQATDRAFRIGQRKNVIVHKLVCKDTIEEKIEEIIESKKSLSESLISYGEEKWLMQMSDEEILDLFKLNG